MIEGWLRFWVPQARVREVSAELLRIGACVARSAGSDSPPIAAPIDENCLKSSINATESVGRFQELSPKLKPEFGCLTTLVRTLDQSDISSISVTLQASGSPKPLLARAGARQATEKRIAQTAGARQSGPEKKPESNSAGQLTFMLRDGNPAALPLAAVSWVEDFGLILMPARARMLASSSADSGGVDPRIDGLDGPDRDTPTAPGGSERPIAAAFAASFDLCFDAIVVQCFAMLEQSSDAERLHDLRVALRRLRSLRSLYKPWVSKHPLDHELQTGLRDFSRELGRRRDQDVWLGELKQRIAAAAPTSAPLLVEQEDVGDDPRVVSTSLPAQRLLLLLLAHRLTLSVTGPPDPIRKMLRRRLASWARALNQQAEVGAKLTPKSMHELRKRIKRLKYGLELSGPVLGSEKNRRYVRRLARAQQSLGQWCDFEMANGRISQAYRDRPSRRFAKGWVGVRMAAARAGALEDLRKLRRTKHGLGKVSAGKRSHVSNPGP